MPLSMRSRGESVAVRNQDELAVGRPLAVRGGGRVDGRYIG
jgi:hypothetical protein